MKVLSWTPTRITARVPSGDLMKGGHRYPVRIQEKNGRLLPADGPLTLRFCPASAVVTPWPADTEPNEILLMVGSEAEAQAIQGANAGGYRVLRRNRLSALSLVLLTLEPPAGVAPEDALETLREAIPGAQVDFNTHYRQGAGPRVYGPDAIAWPEASASCGASLADMRIGMIDGAVDESHPAFATSQFEIRGFADASGPADHGTGVAALLVGSAPDEGFMGLMPFSRLYAADVFSPLSADEAVASAERVARALDWLAGADVRLVNLSIAGGGNLILERVFENALNRGLIPFAAAGNAGADAPPADPAAIDGVIAVTGVDADGRIYSSANQGSYVAFAAPGVDVWSARAGGDGSYHSGTSFAAPFAVAVAAQHLAQRPSLSRDLLIALMKNAAQDLGDKGRDPVFGWGLVQAEPDCS